MQKTDPHLLLYTVANVYPFFCIRRYVKKIDLASEIIQFIKFEMNRLDKSKKKIE